MKDVRDGRVADQLFQRGQDRLLLVVLSGVKPDAGINEDMESRLRAAFTQMRLLGPIYGYRYQPYLYTLPRGRKRTLLCG
jgi:hypothetical protein